jgi:hypothetical protein
MSTPRFASRRFRKGRRIVTCRPLLEVLENRLAPATHTWTGADILSKRRTTRPARWAARRHDKVLLHHCLHRIPRRRSIMKFARASRLANGSVDKLRMARAPLPHGR